MKKMVLINIITIVVLVVVGIVGFTYIIMLQAL